VLDRRSNESAVLAANFRNRGSLHFRHPASSDSDRWQQLTGFSQAKGWQYWRKWRGAGIRHDAAQIVSVAVVQWARGVGKLPDVDEATISWSHRDVPQHNPDKKPMSHNAQVQRI
jgi:hypothetical protein